jgi:hypothetical protein
VRAFVHCGAATESDGHWDEQTIQNVFQLNKGNAAFRAISDVFPVRLIDDDMHLGEFKESSRFDVFIHFVAPFFDVLLITTK